MFFSSNFQFHASALARQSLYVKFDPLMKDLNGQSESAAFIFISINGQY